MTHISKVTIQYDVKGHLIPFYNYLIEKYMKYITYQIITNSIFSIGRIPILNVVVGKHLAVDFLKLVHEGVVLFFLLVYWLWHTGFFYLIHGTALGIGIFLILSTKQVNFQPFVEFLGI